MKLFGVLAASSFALSTAPFIPNFGSVSSILAPNAAMSFWRSILIELGIVRMSFIPSFAAIIASPTPVFPLVGSIKTLFLSILPELSASFTICHAMRSLTEWLGFKNSALARMRAFLPNVLILTNGVLPMSSVTSFAIFIFFL